MPKRSDIRKVLIIGSGPIVIGQGCEFDYSGTQACKALREEGIEIVLVNSNPATIMTDPQFADRTYIEPIIPDVIEKILEVERKRGAAVDAVLPTLGGQTGLNTAVECADRGIWERHGVEMIGADRDVIAKAETRTGFKQAMDRIGLETPTSGVAHGISQAKKILEFVKLPCCIRPAYTLGGHGGGFATTREEFETLVRRGLESSRIGEILIEESVYGWKEYELEVMRDRKDNVVIVCSIENFDPMGVHTGDSITVAPSQTLTDKEYQRMRDAAIAIMREIGVETGGSNIQFAVNPQDGRMGVIEMNPRVSRSSALASKATGFPIAKIAAKLAIGYTLDEIPNDITRRTPACFEPTIDYCVVKIPRWTFEKFPEADETLTTQMKSVGEAMSIGRTFKEALQKGVRSMEVRRHGLGLDRNDKWWVHREVSRGENEEAVKRGKTPRGGSRLSEAEPDWMEEAAAVWPIDDEAVKRKLTIPCQGRLYYIRYAFKKGWSVDQVEELTKIDPWFLTNMKELVDFERRLVEASELAADNLAGDEISPSAECVDLLRTAKQLGYSDIQLATVWNIPQEQIRQRRRSLGLEPVYKLVDTCAAEFEAYTPYYYSSHESPAERIDADRSTIQVDSSDNEERRGEGRRPSPLTELHGLDDEIRITQRPKIVILGGGPNRIGQGIEFDYCCVHAAFAAREMGYEAVMINSNPETVSTDYDTSDMLFFEPLTLEDVLHICERINGAPLGEEGLLKGVIVQFGGQTPLNLAQGLEQAGVPIVGTSPQSIRLAEDREQFQRLLKEIDLRQPPNGVASNPEEAVRIAGRIGYPVLVRPGFVLGGRGMEIVYDDDTLRRFMREAVEYSEAPLHENPVLLDKFLELATEVDIDCISDGREVVVAGVMEHIEEAGIHSGDSACALPPYSLSQAVIDQMKECSVALARRLDVRGLMNVQYAVKDEQVYVLEVNPRASRTIPFVSKATGVAWAKMAAKVMCGMTLSQLGVVEPPRLAHTCVKESVFPFAKFPGVDVVLGPEMRSTGEVMGIDDDFPMAFAKSQMAASAGLPTSGAVFISVRDADKGLIIPIARKIAEMGFEIISSEGTHGVLSDAFIESRLIPKIVTGERPNMLDLIEEGKIALVINTPTRKGKETDEGRLRAAAVLHEIPMITTITGAAAAARSIEAFRGGGWGVRALQDYLPQYDSSGNGTA
jgi:carbamoyl-phosphate synthase large subunit